MTSIRHRLFTRPFCQRAQIRDDGGRQTHRLPTDSYELLYTAKYIFKKTKRFFGRNTCSYTLAVATSVVPSSLRRNKDISLFLPSFYFDKVLSTSKASPVTRAGLFHTEKKRENERNNSTTTTAATARRRIRETKICCPVVAVAYGTLWGRIAAHSESHSPSARNENKKIGRENQEKKEKKFVRLNLSWRALLSIVGAGERKTEHRKSHTPTFNNARGRRRRKKMRKKRGKLKFTRNVLCHYQRKLFSPAILWKRKRRIQFILCNFKFRNLNAARRIYNNNKKRCRQKVYTSSGERELESWYGIDDPSPP